MSSTIQKYKKLILLLWGFSFLISIVFFCELEGFITFPSSFSSVSSSMHYFLFLCNIGIVAIVLFAFLKRGSAQTPNNLLGNNKEIPNERNLGDGDVNTQNSEELNVMLENLCYGLEGIDNVESLCESVLTNLAKEFGIVQGIFYVFDSVKFKPRASFAFYSESDVFEFVLGEGISGQVAKNQEILFINNIPENYITILSGLGENAPTCLALVPVIYEGDTVGVIEFATFAKVDNKFIDVLEAYGLYVGQQLHLIEKIVEMDRLS